MNMSKKLKLLPAFVMLLAGAFTSIITYLVRYDSKVALTILLCVLVTFYILGLVLQRVIYKFELANEPVLEEENGETTDEEGKVVEKDGDVE